MFLEFRVENHRSLREEQAFSLVASNRLRPDDRIREVAGTDVKILPAAVIYGGNASGKSNVLSAMSYLRDAVVYSHRAWNPEGGVARMAFAWGDASNADSLYEITCVVEGTKYEYGFVVSDDCIEEEWITAWRGGREEHLLDRVKNQFTLGDRIGEQGKPIEEATRENALFLSTAAQFGHSILRPLYQFFSKMIISDKTYNSMSGRLGGDPEFLFPSMSMPLPMAFEDGLALKIRKLFVAADIGVVDIKREEIELKVGSRVLKDYRVMFQHQADDDNSWLELAEESAGTRTLFRLAPNIFRTLDTGGVLIVDELEASLHPLIGLKILELFNCPVTNRHNAQLIFTTHDTNLVGTTLGDPPLRRDQIWFTEKDTTGGTRLYPLTDYKPRNVENLERGYLQGRFGAIPFLGNLVSATE